MAILGRIDGDGAELAFGATGEIGEGSSGVVEEEGGEVGGFEEEPGLFRHSAFVASFAGCWFWGTRVFWGAGLGHLVGRGSCARVWGAVLHQSFEARSVAPRFSDFSVEGGLEGFTEVRVGIGCKWLRGLARNIFAAFVNEDLGGGGEEVGWLARGANWLAAGGSRLSGLSCVVGICGGQTSGVAKLGGAVLVSMVRVSKVECGVGERSQADLNGTDPRDADPCRVETALQFSTDGRANSVVN